MLATQVIDFSVRDGCGRDCSVWLKNWSSWWETRVREGHPLAMMETGLGYYANLRPKSRAMVRQANRNYIYRVFDRNDRLSEIDAVNFSKSVRQGRKMASQYQTFSTPNNPLNLCDFHRDDWFGCFRRSDDVLVGYARLESFDDVGILNTILGHGEAIGVMNGMFAHLAENTDVRLINYLRMVSATDDLEAFKRRVGFREWDPRREVFLDGV
jgi:hypothetical protein